MRINGGIDKSKQECQIEWHEIGLSREDIIKQTCKKFNCKEKAKNARLYTKNGVDIGSDDAQFIRPDDILYIALEGKFSNPFTRLATNLVMSRRAV